MADKKSPIAIEMLLAILLIPAALAVVALVPMVECPTCEGTAGFTVYVEDRKRGVMVCDRCASRGKVTLPNKWFMHGAAPSRQ